MNRPRATREQAPLVVLSVMLTISLAYYGAVTLAHRSGRFAVPLFTVKGSSQSVTHVSTMMCHGANRYWAVRVKDAAHDRHESTAR